MNEERGHHEPEIDRRRFLALVTAGLAIVQESPAASPKGHLIDAGPANLYAGDGIYDKFREVNHKLSIERLQTKGKKTARDEKREDLKGGKPGQELKPGQMPQRKKGQSVGDYLDDLMDAKGIMT